MNAIKSQLSNVKVRSPQLDFQYTDPERDFDRKKVKGTVATLFKVTNQKFNTALDTACGGKVTFKDNLC